MIVGIVKPTDDPTKSRLWCVHIKKTARVSGSQDGLQTITNVCTMCQGEWHPEADLRDVGEACRLDTAKLKAKYLYKDTGL